MKTYLQNHPVAVGYIVANLLLCAGIILTLATNYDNGSIMTFAYVVWAAVLLKTTSVLGVKRGFPMVIENALSIENAFRIIVMTVLTGGVSLLLVAPVALLFFRLVRS